MYWLDIKVFFATHQYRHRTSCLKSSFAACRRAALTSYVGRFEIDLQPSDQTFVFVEDSRPLSGLINENVINKCLESAGSYSCAPGISGSKLPVETKVRLANFLNLRYWVGLRKTITSRSKELRHE